MHETNFKNGIRLENLKNNSGLLSIDSNGIIILDTSVAAISAGLDTRTTYNTNSINTLFSTYANSTTVAAISAGVSNNFVHKTLNVNETITGIKTFSASNTIIDSGVTNTAGLQLNRLSTATPVSSGYAGILGVDNSGNVGISTVNSSLFSPALAYWDGLNDPISGGHAYPIPAYSGAAMYIDSTNGVRLTPNFTNENGAINWNFPQVYFERIQFSFKAQGGGGADATWFYAYGDGIPTTEYGTGVTKGYIIGFSEWHNAIALGWGTGVDWNTPSGKYANTLAVVPMTGINNGAFHNVDITILDNRIIIMYDGITIIDYSDMYGRDRTGTFFGFGARTASVTDNHYVKGLVVAKLGENMANYRIVPNNFVYTAPSTTIENTIIPVAISATPLTIRGMLGQVADLQQWSNISGTSLTRITSGGSVVISSISGSNINFVSRDTSGKLLDSGISTSVMSENTNSINTLFSTYANSTTVASISAGLDARLNIIENNEAGEISRAEVAAISASLNTQIQQISGYTSQNTNGINTLFFTYANSTTVAAISAGLNSRIATLESNSGSSSSTSANDARYVHLVGNESISGTKTFLSQISVISGSSLVPSIIFGVSGALGLYAPSLTSVGIAISGVSKVLFDVDGMTLRDSATPTKAYRFRQSGAALDMDFGGGDFYFSAYPTADFSGSQKQVFQSRASTQQICFSTDFFTVSPNTTIDWNGTSSLLLVSPSIVKINNKQSNVDFRVSSITGSNLLYASASLDRLGIGTAAPSAKLHIAGEVIVDSLSGAAGYLVSVDSLGKLLVTNPSIYATNTTVAAVSAGLNSRITVLENIEIGEISRSEVASISASLNTQIQQISGYTGANTNSIGTLFSTYTNSTTVAAISAGLQSQISAISGGGSGSITISTNQVAVGTAPNTIGPASVGVWTATAINGALEMIINAGTSTANTGHNSLAHSVTYSGSFGSNSTAYGFIENTTSSGIIAANNVNIIAINGNAKASPASAVSAVNYVGVQGTVTTNNTGTTALGAATLIGIQSIPQYTGSATSGVSLNNLIGLDVQPTISMGNSAGSTTTINNIIGGWVRPSLTQTVSGATTIISNYYGLLLDTVSVTGAGIIQFTNKYSLYQVDAASTNYIGGTLLIASRSTGGATITSPKGVGVANEGFGLLALSVNVSGSNNTALGNGALSHNTNGSSNTSVGYQSLNLNITGGGNTAIGASAGANQTINSNNTFIGNNSNALIPVSNSTAIGYNSLVTQNNQVVIGANTNLSTVINGSVQIPNISGVGGGYVVTHDPSGTLLDSGILLTSLATTSNVATISAGLNSRITVLEAIESGEIATSVINISSAGIVIDTNSTNGTFGAGEWLIMANNGVASRASKIIANWNSFGVTYTESSTTDLSGSTINLTYNMNVVSNQVRLIANSALGNWSIKFKKNIL